MPSKEVIEEPSAIEDDIASVDDAEEEVKEEEKETLEEPSTLEKPVVEDNDVDVDEEELALQRKVQGLKDEELKLRENIVNLRGEKRLLKTADTTEAKEYLDDLKDLNPDEVGIIERILKAKGYLSKEDAQKQYYKQVEEQEIQHFLDKYPEFKPENDHDDKQWSSLMAEMKDYRKPDNPHDISRFLEKAKKAVFPAIEPKVTQAQKQQERKLSVAGVGSKGAYLGSHSTDKSLTKEQKEELRRGGFTEDDILSMEK